MSIQIETYEPVEQSTTCNRCNSKTVTWVPLHPEKTGRPAQKWRMLEIFTLEGEEVASKEDLHFHYCVKPLYKPKDANYDPLQARATRQIEIDLAAKRWAEEAELPGDKSKTDEIVTDGHPYVCTACGEGVIDGFGDDGHKYVFDFGSDTNGNEKAFGKHTCNSKVTSHIAGSRKVGARAALKVRFVEISDRMEWLHGEMQRMKDAGEKSNLGAEYGAEYLMLRKRLYTEIPK